MTHAGSFKSPDYYMLHRLNEFAVVVIQWRLLCPLTFLKFNYDLVFILY